MAVPWFVRNTLLCVCFRNDKIHLKFDLLSDLVARSPVLVMPPMIYTIIKY